MKKMPEAIRDKFLEKGIKVESALTVFKTDCTADRVPCDAYTAVTEEGIATLFCLESLKKRSGVFFWSRQKPERSLEILDFTFTPLSEAEEIVCEELLSGIRLIARRGGEDRILLYATNRCAKKLYDFRDAFTEFRETGAYPAPAADKDARCPRCGRPYRDPERKVCRHCSRKTGLVKKLLPFMKRYRWQIVLVLFTIAVSGLLDVLTPYLSGKVLYDEVLKPEGSLYGRILFLVAVVAGANLVVAVTNMLSSFVSARVSAYVTYDLKKTIFSAFERLSYSFFTARHTGKLMTQINTDAETLYWFFCDGVPYFLTNILQILGIAVVMLTIQPLLTLAIFLPLPLLFLGYYLVLRHLKKLHAENYNHKSRFNSILSDVLGGMRIVKAFSRERSEIARFGSAAGDLTDSNVEIGVTTHTLMPLLNVWVRLTAYLVWGLGGYLVIRSAAGAGSGISYGTLMLFISYLSLIYGPLNFFADFFADLASSLNALQRLFEIVETEPEVREKENAVSIPRVKGLVEFENVSFSYTPGKKTVRDVSFTVPAGETLGIVGHTGAGKSTLANLLTRLYDVESGAIRIDGVDVRDLSLATLRENVAIVSQETYLFRGSILDNIRYSAPGATVEECIAASRAAGCHDFIMSFPDGYDTMVGYDKKLLSGGEKQRISIARAILKDPAILILDEATSAMDTRTERKIQEALSAITRGRTTISIAHRLSTLRDADRLIVMEEGRLVEAGTHEELLKKEDGVYAKLYRLQLEALKNIGIEEAV
ncbi:MAG: ATP-binding cassette domain-containing protein [Clostridia bacterium]|nr:ATP-binding cassette domain-containing protein [Clostridia bacterium]